MEKDKKCILVIQHFTGIGGASLASLDVMNALLHMGRDAYLLLPGKDSPLAEMAKSKGYNVVENCPPVINYTYHNASSGAVRAVIKWLININYTKRWKEIMTSFQPDMVVLNSSAQSPMIDVVNELNVRCICYVRETVRGNRNFILNKLLRKQIGKAWGVGFLTDFDKSSWNIRSNKNQWILPDVVSSQHYLLGKDQDKGDVFHVLYLGGFSYEKGINDIIEAFGCIKDHKIMLHILGDTGEQILKLRGIKKLLYYKEGRSVKKAYQKINAINHLCTQIYVEGIQNNVSEWYGMANAVVFPVKKVHQARPIYEAGWYGVPCVVPDYENFKDSLIHEYNGLTYKKNDPHELANAILRLADNEDLCKKLGENNRQMTLKNHGEFVLQARFQQMIGEE